MSAELPTSSGAESGLEYDFEESVGYWMVLAAQAFQKALNDELAPHGITFRQCQVLGWLALDGELSQVDLASRMMIEPATLVGVLDRMERDGLIYRQATATDRRRKMIRVSPQAKDVWAKVVCCARKVRSRAVVGLTPNQVHGLIKTLRTVLGNLSAG
jgi:MarR family transcriptional regulator, transcriptional regulator for hemolysin